MKAIPFPQVYPGGGPLYWRDEQSGWLLEAVEAYYEFLLKGRLPPQAQLELLTGYVAYWVHAPCWTGLEEDGSDLEQLRNSAKSIRSWPELRDWCEKAMDLGIDPF